MILGHFSWLYFPMFWVIWVSPSCNHNILIKDRQKEIGPECKNVMGQLKQNVPGFENGRKGLQVKEDNSRTEKGREMDSPLDPMEGIRLPTPYFWLTETDFGVLTFKTRE